MVAMKLMLEMVVTRDDVFSALLAEVSLTNDIVM